MKHDSFYDSAKWKQIRKSVLVRDKYQDQILKQYSLIPKEANLVHHIFPREFFPEFQYEKWNLISISLETHNKLHDRNGGFLTQKGLNLLKKTARKNGVFLTQEMIEKCTNFDSKKSHQNHNF